MIVRNKLWNEIDIAHANVICITHYTSGQRKCNRAHQLFIGLCAGCGVVVYPFAEWAPIISTIAISLVSIVKAVFPQLTQSEEELCKLDGIMEYYIKYQNFIEKLLYDLDEKIKTEDEVLTILLERKEIESQMLCEMNRLVRWIPNFQRRRNDNENQIYLKEVHYNIYGE